MFSLYGWTAFGPIKSRDCFFFFQFPPVLINTYVRVHVWVLKSSGEQRVPPVPSYRRGPATLPSHWGFRLSQREQNEAGNVVACTHARTRASDQWCFREHSTQLQMLLVTHTSVLLLGKKQVGSTLRNILYFPRNLRGDTRRSLACFPLELVASPVEGVPNNAAHILA